MQSSWSGWWAQKAGNGFVYCYASVIHRNGDLGLLEVYVHQSMTGSDGHVTPAYETLPEEVSKNKVTKTPFTVIERDTETQEPSNITVTFAKSLKYR